MYSQATHGVEHGVLNACIAACLLGLEDQFSPTKDAIVYLDTLILDLRSPIAPVFRGE